jgi:hypothetical protein
MQKLYFKKIKSFEKLLLSTLALVLIFSLAYGGVFADNTCPSGMSNLDCQAIVNNWTQWVPDVSSSTTVSGCDFGTSTGPFTTGSTQLTTNSNEISVTQMCGRVQQFVYDHNSPVYQEFLNSCSTKSNNGAACGEGWCALSTAIAWGYGSSGYNAIDLWNHLNGEGYGHPGDLSPPVGALLFYHSLSPDGHVTVYLGNNMVMSTDVRGSGVVGEDPSGPHDGYAWVAPETTVEAWVSAPSPYTSNPYIGWADPVFSTSQVP